MVGKYYDEHFTAKGADGNVVFVVTSGRLPPGLALLRDGRLRGMPSKPGTYKARPMAVDNKGSTGFDDYVLEIDEPDITFDPDELIGPARVGIPYMERIGACGGAAPYRFSSTSRLPPGIKLSPRGYLWGKPTRPGTVHFGVKVVDKGGNTESKAFALTVRR